MTPDMDQGLPEDIALEHAISVLERRALHNETLGRAERTSPASKSVASWHLMQAQAIRVVVPHAKAALAAMRQTPGQSVEDLREAVRRLMPYARVPAQRDRERCAAMEQTTNPAQDAIDFAQATLGERAAS